MSTLASVIQRGLYSALPSAGIAGRLYFCSDSSGTYKGAIYYDDGTNWDGPYGGGGGSSTTFEVNGTALSSSTTVNFENGSNVTITNPSAGNVSIAASGGGGGTGMGTAFTAPPTTGWSWVNQGTASVISTSVGQTVQIPDTGGGSLSMVFRLLAIPSAPFAISIYHRSFQFSQNSALSGVYFYDDVSGKAEGIEYVTQDSAQYPRVQQINSTTSDGTTVWAPISSDAANFGGPPYGGIWTKLRSDGTDLYYYVSLDGAAWILLWSEAIGSFLTPTHIGFGGSCLTGNSAMFVTSAILSWAQSTS